ncbi:MAG: outer membrane protein assembly factor BamA [Glaciecola sp.]
MSQFQYFVFLIVLWLSSYSSALGQNLTLKIDGIDNSETKIIDSLSYRSAFINYKSLNEEVLRTYKRLQNIGFIESTLVETVKINDSVYQSIFSLKNKFYTMYIYYDKSLISENLIKAVSTDYNDDYFVLPVIKIESALGYINSELTNKGLPFAKFRLQNIEKRDFSNLQANLLVDKNNERTIDNIVIKGYEQFPRSYINHFLKIKHKQLFNLNNIKKKTERLNDLPFTNQTKSPEVLFTKDSTTLYLYLEKTKSNAFDGFLGFGTNEATNKLEFDGYLNLNLTNNLNYGEQFNLIYKSDENEQKTLDVNFTLPYLFGLPLGTEFALNIFKKDSTFTTVNQDASIFYQINSKHKLIAGINVIQSNNLINQLTTTNIRDYNSIFYKTRYTFKQPKFYDILFPLDLLIDASLGFGSRNSDLKTEQQTELKLKVSKILNLDEKNSFYIKTKGNVLLSDSYFTNELFRFGGINSIRGFEENSILASYYGLINLEYRYRLNSSIYIHSITDGAYFENKIIGTKEKLFGFGFGFGVLTKAGILKLNYANGKSENQKFKFSNSKIHLSLNAIF